MAFLSEQLLFQTVNVFTEGMSEGKGDSSDKAAWVSRAVVFCAEDDFFLGWPNAAGF